MANLAITQTQKGNHGRGWVFFLAISWARMWRRSGEIRRHETEAGSRRADDTEVAHFEAGKRFRWRISAAWLWLASVK